MGSNILPKPWGEEKKVYRSEIAQASREGLTHLSVNGQCVQILREPDRTIEEKGDSGGGRVEVHL